MDGPSYMPGIVCFISLYPVARKSALSLIAVQPVGTNVLNSGTVSLTATAVSSTSMTLTWLLNNTNAVLANANVVNVAGPSGTVSTLTVSNVVPANAGKYSLKVVNNVGSVISSNAIVSVDGGISVDHTSSRSSGNGTTVSWSHIIGTGDNGFLLVNVSTASGHPASSVTCQGGVSDP